MRDIFSGMNNIEPYELDLKNSTIVIVDDWHESEPELKTWNSCHMCSCNDHEPDDTPIADQWETIAREYGDKMNDFRSEVIELRRFLAEKDLLDTFLAWKAKAKS